MRLVSRIKLLLGFTAAVLMTCIAYPLGRLIYSNKGVWIIGERPEQAQDNGYHFFKYMREKHTDRPVYYAITKDSPHRAKVEALGDTVYYGTFKYWLMYYGCDAVISDHIRSLLPCGNNWWYNNLASRHKQKNKKQVFLQHGVIQSNIPRLYKEKTQVDLFICGAKPEFDYIRENYHYSDDEVKYTGLARYDALHDITVKKQILIMPTWRKWMMTDIDKLAGTEYVLEWNKLLCDKAMLDAAESAGYKIVFYLHANLQFARELFKSTDDSVVIARDRDFDVQTLLKESALLITDYSSVYFDFAYMRKPVLYFQFDRERFFDEHYPKGYFDHERDGFGKVAYTEPELAEDFTQLLDKGLILSEKYSARINGFFPLYDRKNCERIYNEVSKICG